MASEQFSLCWDNFHKNMSTGMSSLLENEDLVDVTIAVEGQYLKAHKMVLSVCSPYFRELFKVNPCKHPIVFMKDVSYIAMSDLLQFMYQGEVQVSQDNLATFIKTAEALQIKGLTGDGNGLNESESDSNEPSKHTETDTAKPNLKVKKQLSSSPAAKRQKLSTKEPAHTVTEINEKKRAPSPTVETTQEELISFKMEPYDQSQSITLADDASDNAYSEDQLDDQNVDDCTEDYTMIEDEEPKPGTSADISTSHSITGVTSADISTSEGQDATDSRSKRKRNMPRYIVDGFVFHVNITKGKPPMIYLRCLEYKRLGCHARAVIPYEGSIHDIKLNKPHNHPPDFAAEEKIIFMRELKEIILKKPNVPAKNIYASLSEMYPNAARETPFDSIRYKMNRWRRQSDQ